MKRFTETCKWDDPWFRSLTGIQKLVFLYVIDRCNNAGFWEIDEDSMAFHTKIKPEHISGAWQGLGRGLIAADGWVWVRRFLRHQKNDHLNVENNAHKQIISLIEEQMERFKSAIGFNEFLAQNKGLFSPSTGAQVKVKDRSITQKGSQDGKTAEQILDSFRGNAAYEGIDLDREFDKMKNWLQTPPGKGRRLTHRFIVSWLNKAEPTLRIEGRKVEHFTEDEIAAQRAASREGFARDEAEQQHALAEMHRSRQCELDGEEYIPTPFSHES